MEEEKIKEFRQNGFYVFSNLQFYLTLIIFLLTTSIAIGGFIVRLDKVEDKAREAMLQIEGLKDTREGDSDLQKEIKFNLKILMGKFNLKYIEDVNLK